MLAFSAHPFLHIRRHRFKQGWWMWAVYASMLYQAFTNVGPGLYQYWTRPLPMLDQAFTNVGPGLYQCCTRPLPMSYQAFTNVVPGLYRDRQLFDRSYANKKQKHEHGALTQVNMCNTHWLLQLPNAPTITTVHTDDHYCTHWRSLLYTLTITILYTLTITTVLTDDHYCAHWWSLLYTLTITAVHTDDHCCTHWWPLLYTLMITTVHTDDHCCTHWLQTVAGSSRNTASEACYRQAPADMNKE